MSNPIIVNSSPFPATIASAVRSVLSLLGAVAVALGWIRAESVEGYATIAFTVIATGYGVWKQFSKSSDLATVASMVPDSIAQVK